MTHAHDGTNAHPLVLLLDADGASTPRYEAAARRAGLRTVCARAGDIGLALVRQLEPSAVVMDVDIPAMDGWVVLDRLKQDARTRAIPVYVASRDERRMRALRFGAYGYISKPLTDGALDGAFRRLAAFIEDPIRSVLALGAGAARVSLEQLRDDALRVRGVSSVSAALSALHAERFDAIVWGSDFDLDAGDALLAGAAALLPEPERCLPAVRLATGFTPRGDGPDEPGALPRFDAESPEHAGELLARLLHLRDAAASTPAVTRPHGARRPDPVLARRRVLIVDDEPRSAFAMRHLLESRGTSVAVAASGEECLEALSTDAAVDAVLMDMLMPGLDGYETMRRIRAHPQTRALPIIAVTARAMTDDGVRCLEAGASDYVAKPVDDQHLLSVLRVRLARW